MTVTDELVVGLRFRKSQARVLDALVQRGMSEGVAKEHMELFSKSAESARSGDPLHMQCASLDEARAVAEGFTLWGVVPPTLEEVRA